MAVAQALRLLRCGLQPLRRDGITYCDVDCDHCGMMVAHIARRNSLVVGATALSCEKVCDLASHHNCVALPSW